MNWYTQVLSKYAEFNGRARRSEYWYFWWETGKKGLLIIEKCRFEVSQ